MSDAVVIGSGPNGLAAAITLAKAGLSVVIYEAHATVGGGMRSEELTLPGYVHDVCSAIHPLALSSPFFHTLPLEIEWIHPPTPLAHPHDDGTAVLLENSLELTAKNLGNDGDAYTKLMEPLVKNWEKLAPEILAPLHLPRHPWLLSRFGWYGLKPAEKLWNQQFKEERARSLFAGLAAHSMMPLDRRLTSAFGLVLSIQAHHNGWPLPKGGSQTIADTLATYFKSLGGKIVTNTKIETLPDAKIVMCDTSPKQLMKLAQFPEKYKRKLENFRYGQGVFKLDWALSDPIPWKAKEAKEAGTLHIGGTAEEIARCEKQVWENIHPEKPFVILSQPTLFDPTRAPRGKHTAWAYCHVPAHSDVDMTEQIENQIERFAPGFKECILARSKRTTTQIEQYNPNYVGGDINSGVETFFPYKTPLKGVYLCSASTPPGGGVHGICGFISAKQALAAIGL